jgi:hypothetical protein
MEPAGDGSRDFFVPIAKLEHLQRSGPKQHFYDALLLGEVLSRPKVVFCGLEREDFNAAYCYAKIPSKRYRSHDVELPPLPGYTFLVFVRQDFVILDWEWRKADPSNPDYPENWETDFGEKVWP